MAQRVGQGGSITLDAYYRDGTGSLVDPVNPLVDIFDSANVNQVLDVAPVRISVGHYAHTYVVPVNGAEGVWRAHWSGVINGALSEDDDYFEVVAAGSIDFNLGIQPGSEEVHALIPQRAAGKVFGVNTIPTLAQVEGLVTNIATDVATYVNYPIREDLEPLGRLAVAYGAAAEIERGLFPGEGEDNDYENLHAKFVELRDRLKDLAESTEGSGAGAPRGSFPVEMVEGEERYRPISSLGF